MSGSKTTQTNSALPQYSTAYGSLLNQAQQTGSTPYQPYTGELTAGLTPNQTSASNLASTVAGSSGYGTAQPYFDAAQGYYTDATTPLWDTTQQFSPDAVAQYESPYTNDVVNATQSQFNLQNAQQQAQLNGNVAAAGAFGGDRQAVLQAELAGQQQTAQAPVIAGLENTGYQTALGEFNTEQAGQLSANTANAGLDLSAGTGIAGLGTTAQQLGEQGVAGLAATGGTEQTTQQAADTAQLQQWEQALQFPYSQESWLSGLETSLGGAAGSTSTQQQQNSLLSSIFGGLESAAGIAGMFGAKRGGGIAPQHRARGGRGLPMIHGYADGGSPFDPEPITVTPAANDLNPPVADAAQANGTTGMPFPNVDYTPQAIPNTWSEQSKLAPWEALLEAGGETLATGNVGKGISAGLQSYQGTRKAAQEAQTAATVAQNEGLYRQADIRDAANKLWSDAQEAKARLNQSDAELSETRSYHQGELGMRQQELSQQAKNEAATRGIQQEALEQGKFQMMPGMGPDTTDPTKQVAGSYVLNAKTGKSEFQPGVILTPRGMSPDSVLNPDAVKFYGEQLARGDTSVLQNLGRGAQAAQNVVAVRNAAYNFAKANNIDPSAAMNSVAEFAGQKAGQRALGTRTAQVGMAVNEASQFIDLSRNAYQKLPRGQFVPFNKLQNLVENQTSSPEQAAAYAADNSLINAYARAVSPTGAPTVNDKEHAREMLTMAQSQEAHDAVLNQLHLEMQAAQKSPGVVRQEFRQGYSGNEGANATSAPQSGFVEGKIYKDAHGNRARFVNGAWVPVP